MEVEVTNAYKDQLKQVELALEKCSDGPEKDELLALKTSITELLALTTDPDNSEDAPSTSSNADNTADPMANEFELFMLEMAKDGAVAIKTKPDLDKYKALDGMKCRAPHKHQWGGSAYHNAMVCSVLGDNASSEAEIEVKVLFTNPTHQEMLPCPYYFDSDCKFSEEKCRFSHGEIVRFVDLHEYIEPKFEELTNGAAVLAKKDDNLWHRAIVRRVYDDKVLVKFESNQRDVEVMLEHIFPLTTEGGDEQIDSEGDDSVVELDDDDDDVINMSLMVTPSSQALGEWERYTKGIGSKLMEKMGYIVGTGLGRRADGRIDPVTAVVMPAGKSLDHCMRLRENAGGDKDLFSAERKLKRLQRRQEIQNERAYERERNKVDVFNFINKTLSGSGETGGAGLTKSSHRRVIKSETSRNLNVAGLQIDENIRRVERDVEKINESLTRHKDVRSQVHKSLREKLAAKQSELNSLNAQAVNIRQEQSVRSDKRKLTIF